MTTGAMRATMRLAPAGKRMVAESMYLKGKSFLGAALLLRQHGAYEYVVLHMLCQSIEIVLKALLLWADYDTFHPKLKAEIGHNIVRAADIATAAYKFRPISSAVRAELEGLNLLYKSHRLRYGSEYDLLVDPSTVPSRLVFRHAIAMVRLVERQRRATGHG